MAITASDRCCICAHPINTSACPHPWAEPFSDWPAGLLAQLKRLLPVERHAGS